MTIWHGRTGHSPNASCDECAPADLREVRREQESLGPPRRVLDDPCDCLIHAWYRRPRCYFCGARLHWLFGICLGGPS